MPTRASAAVPPAKRVARRPLSGVIVLDSSCWLEHFAESPRAALFAPAIDRTDALVVPLITICEVVKKLARELGDEVAAQALTLMQQGRVVEIDIHLALAAARNGLPLADSLIYATARTPQSFKRRTRTSRACRACATSARLDAPARVRRQRPRIAGIWQRQTRCSAFAPLRTASTTSRRSKLASLPRCAWASASR